MRLGISVPYWRPDGTALQAREVMARASLIERVGFDGIWLGESIGRSTSPRPDPLAWLVLCAAGTEGIELGTAVLQLPLRHPAELAQRLISMHALCGGRFVAGLGAGSTRADYAAVGVDFDSRFKMLADGLRIVRGLCRGEQVGDAYLAGWPDRAGGPPIVIGAWASGIWVKRAARDYDGWMGSGRSGTFRELKDGITRFRDAGGTRALVNTVTVDLHAPNTNLDEDAVFSLKCGPQEAAERLHRLAEIGFDDVGLVQLGHTDADLPEDELRAIRALLPSR